MFEDIFKLDASGKPKPAAGAVNAGDAQRKAWLKRTRAIVHGGKDVGWLDDEGKPVTGAVMDKLKAMKKPIPPAWTDVRITTDPKASVLVEGVDGKGRPTKIYSAEHTAASANAKFARVAELDSKIDGLVSQTRKDMRNKNLDERTRDNAATINLVTLTGFRPGSTRDTQAEEQAYGASTLEKRHIKVKGDAVSFEFTGKKGVKITKVLNDKTMAGYLNERLPTLAPTEKVFQTSGASAMNYMRKQVGDQFKVKDLRTWNGTALARHLVGNEKPSDDTALKALQKKVSESVSTHLGNTPKIAFESYIDPSVWPSTAPTTKVKKS